MLDLGGGTHARLTHILLVAPPDAVTLDPPAHGTPTSYVRLVNNMGVLPCYEKVEEIHQWFDEYAEGFPDLGEGFRCNIDHVVGVVSPLQFVTPQGYKTPECVLQMDDGSYCPCYITEEAIVGILKRSTEGFFGS